MVKQLLQGNPQEQPFDDSTPGLDQLAAHYRIFGRYMGRPLESADEELRADDLTPMDRAWLDAFVVAWDIAADAEEPTQLPGVDAEERRTRELEAEGLTRSDAQGVVEAEALKRARP